MEVIHNARSAAYDLLEGREGAGDCNSKLIRSFIIALIVLNGIAVILESNHDYYVSYLELFNAFEVFSVVIFTGEYFGRLWVAAERPYYSHLPSWKARLSFMFSPMALVDLLAIAPFYLAMFIPIDLRYLRFFRLLRLLKLSHYFDGLRVFASVIQREASAIAGALLTMLTLIIISACLMFTVENAASPGHFESINQAIWWAVVTLTTVGYGDITPITFGGKLLAIVIMLLGVGTMALPAGILAARFTEELQTRREIMSRQVVDALKDGVLDINERDAIKKLQDELGLSRDVVQHIVAIQRQTMERNRYCPHCGEQVGDQ
ncbi:MAG: potassium channel family protein [Gammaproteobacteria bacterium]|nr:potassium channel family protein [Gammaproteobacteria bacterium]